MFVHLTEDSTVFKEYATCCVEVDYGNWRAAQKVGCKGSRKCAEPMGHTHPFMDNISFWEATTKEP